MNDEPREVVDAQALRVEQQIVLDQKQQPLEIAAGQSTQNENQGAANGVLAGVSLFPLGSRAGGQAGVPSIEALDSDEEDELILNKSPGLRNSSGAEEVD